MSDKISALSKPGGRFIISILASVIAALVCCIIMYSQLSTDVAGKIVPAQKLRTGATISDILATIITISGVTAPLVVAYLLIRERELQSFFIERMTEYLSYHGCDLVVCRVAYLALCENSTNGNPSADLRTLHFLSTLTTEEEPSPSSREAIKAVIADSRIRNKYFACFSEDQDKDWLKNCVFVIGFSASLCFVDLYMRVFVEFSYIGDLAELFLIVSTIGANISAYVLVLDFVTTKGSIKRQSAHLIKDCCARAAPEIFRARRDAEKVRDKLNATLQDMMEALRG